MPGRRQLIKQRFYVRTARLEMLLMAIFSHPATDPVIKARIQAEFIGTTGDKSRSSRSMHKLQDRMKEWESRA